MDRKDRTTEHCPDSREQSFYQTGSTRPAKSIAGFVAVLLAAVIFIGGIFSILGLMKIRLFQQLSGEGESPYLLFAQTDNTAATAEESELSGPDIGFSCRSITAFDRQYYQLPEGVYITKIDAASDAGRKGVMSGDILLEIEGMAVTDADTLETILCVYEPGAQVKIVLFRDETRRTLHITLG